MLLTSGHRLCRGDFAVTGTDASPSKPFVVSLENFAQQARARKWDFWRGYLVGILSTFVVAYPLLLWSGNP